MPFVAFLTAASLIDSEGFDKAKIAYEKARYEDVIKVLRDADLAPLTPEQRAEARFILGVSELASNRDALSQKAFVALYTDAPDYEAPPYTAKKILAAVERAKRQVSIELQPALKDGAVAICGRGLPKRSEVKVVFQVPEGEEGGLATLEGKCFLRSLPPSGRATGYYAVAALDGEVRATVGSRAQPLPLDRGNHRKEIVVAAEPPGTPWYKHWATWTVVGVLVAGGIAGGIAGGVIASQNTTGTLHMSFVFPGGGR